MYAITGVTGKVGSEVAKTLLNNHQQVRAVLRDQSKANRWSALGCEVAIASMEDSAALSAAFADAEGVFILPPPDFDPEDGFPEAKRAIESIRLALDRARPQRVVCLSTIGAQSERDNLLSQRTLMEQALASLSVPITFLRPAWFMENFAWDVASAKRDGVIASFLQPIERAIPMIATADVGRVAAELLQESWTGNRIVELEASTRVAPIDAATVFSNVLGRPVRAEAIPRDTWEPMFRSQGMQHPMHRIRMLDGFNEGWIRFESDDANIRKGALSLEDVLRELVRHTD
ncbi:NmrA family NAD(P)-binding protein [Dyella sp. 2HG41-7]|uniref:NmrA family NAD(P)-binding protein n=1 Tax=Dyella sp. 2HG41-7 TaxID=2883239 RepID=UPI001F2CFAAE|nr:NmrA family NAD(P)-binding protein [Dyella sp. 2HG41-7]